MKRFIYYEPKDTEPKDAGFSIVYTETEHGHKYFVTSVPTKQDAIETCHILNKILAENS